MFLLVTGLLGTTELGAQSIIFQLSSIFYMVSHCVFCYTIFKHIYYILLLYIYYIILYYYYYVLQSITIMKHLKSVSHQLRNMPLQIWLAIKKECYIIM